MLTAADGDIGLEILKTDPCLDCIPCSWGYLADGVVCFSDIMMPKMNGDVCVERYREWEVSDSLERPELTGCRGSICLGGA